MAAVVIELMRHSAVPVPRGRPDYQPTCNPCNNAVVWSVALIWMGSACLMNARRCGRTHCRYTGPYYLALVIPVVILGLGLLPLGPYAWWILGSAILFGGKIIWWATEAAWGKFRTGA